VEKKKDEEEKEHDEEEEEDEEDKQFVIAADTDRPKYNATIIYIYHQLL
jgi:hypothetical protein